MSIPKYTTKDVERFWSKVDKSAGDDGCWLWTSHILPNGYGTFWLKRPQLAHRIAYLISKGNIPNDLQVCHSCDVRNCVNPNHLWLGTARDNAQDREEKGRGNGRKNYGEAHPASKLTAKEVALIRERYSQGNILHKELAGIYHVDRKTIGNIINYKTWRR